MGLDAHERGNKMQRDPQFLSEELMPRQQLDPE